MQKIYLTNNIIREIKNRNNNIYLIKTLAEISSNKELMNKLSSLVKRNYESMHHENPIKSIGLKEWKSLILAEDTILNGSYIFVHEKQSEMIAYYFLHESDTMNVGELGWCG